MEEQEKQRQQAILDTLLPEGKVHSRFSIDVFGLFHRQIISVGLRLTEDLLEELLGIFNKCQRPMGSISVSDLEFSDALYCLYVLDPPKADVWLTRLVQYLRIDRQFSYKPAYLDPPFAAVLAGFILAIFKTVERRTWYLKGEATAFSATFPTVISQIINFGSNYPLLNSNKIDKKAFAGHLSTLIKSCLNDVYMGEKVKQLYRDSLGKIDLKRNKLELLGKILFDEIKFALFDSLEPEEQLRLLLATQTPQAGLENLAQEVEKDFPPGAEFPVADGDYQTHFDVGMSFKEMGRYEEAIEEFEVAAKLAKTSDDRLKCQNMKATCLEELAKK